MRNSGLTDIEYGSDMNAVSVLCSKAGRGAYIHTKYTIRSPGQVGIKK